MRRTHPLIVGGGPAGAMAAITLARAGQRPLLLERAPVDRDIVCGGFLGWDALAMLGRIGVDAFALGGQRITRLRLIAGGRTAAIDLPFAASGLSRQTLDHALLARAVDDGAGIERGVTVRQIDPERLSLRTKSDELNAPAIFLATGKHDLRGALRRVTPEPDPPVGMRVRLAATPALNRALAGHIELILFDRGYAGLILQEDGDANLCFTIAQSRLDEAGGDRAALLADLAIDAPMLGERIGQAGGLGHWASIARVPYGWKTSETSPGLFRLGDQAAVIASLAGDGIAIALNSAHGAAEHYLRNGPQGAQDYQRSFAKAARKPLWIADRMRAMAENARLAALGTATLRHFPAAGRIATRATRIGIY